MPKFYVEMNESGRGKVIVDETDLSNEVTALRVDAALGKPTLLTLELSNPGVIQGEGIVQILRDAESPDLAQFVKSLNASEIEQEAMNRMGWGSDATLTQTILEVIAEKLNASESQGSPTSS